MILFGGFQQFDSTLFEPTNNLFAFVFANASWVELLPTSIGPSPRVWFSMSSIVQKDSSSNQSCQALLFGGLGPTQEISNETWILTVHANLSATWQRLIMEISPPARMMSSLVSISNQSSLVLFGLFRIRFFYCVCWSNVVTGGTNKEVTFKDLWIFSNDTWSLLPQVGLHTVKPRYGHSMAYDSQLNSLWVLGGKRRKSPSSAPEVEKSVARYSLSTFTWVLEEPLELARSQNALLIFNSTLFSFGGMSILGEYSFAFNDLLATDGNATCDAYFWCATIDILGSTKPSSRFDFAYALRNENELVLFGGRDHLDLVLGDLWRLNFTQQPEWYFRSEGLGDDLMLMTIAFSMQLLLAMLALMVATFWVFVYYIASTQVEHENTYREWVQQQQSMQQRPDQHGVRADFINALPVRIFVESPPGSEDNPCCAICLGEYVSNDSLLTLPCHHDFHSSCIREWLGNKNSCPLCKQLVDPQSVPMSEELIPTANPQNAVFNEQQFRNVA
jgi:hypothetical protein